MMKEHSNPQTTHSPNVLRTCSIPKDSRRRTSSSMLSTNPLISPELPPFVKMCFNFWTILSVYNFRMYIYVSRVVRRSIFGPFSNPWRCSVFHFTKRAGKWQISRDTSNHSCILIGICEDGQLKISSWLSIHSQRKQTACKQLLS